VSGFMPMRYFWVVASGASPLGLTQHRAIDNYGNRPGIVCGAPRLAVVDCLRGIAALIVLGWYFRFFFGTPFNATLAPSTRAGAIAVDLFL